MVKIKLNWTWFHRFGSPKWLMNFIDNWLPWFISASVSLLLISLIWGLAFTPEDYKQGHVYRIIYIHVPTAIVSLAAYYLMAISAIVSIIWRIKVTDFIIRSIAPVGLAFTLIALITGSIWGKPTWGTYWVWQDPRLISMLILFFLYWGVISLHDAFYTKKSGSKASSILILVGTVNIPIIYKSVDWWSSLHQPASLKITEPSTIASEMIQPLLLAIPSVYLLFFALVMLQLRYYIAHNEQNTNWMKTRSLKKRI